MKPLLLRIGLHGGGAAVLLAILGYYMADLSAMWLVGQSSPQQRDTTDWVAETTRAIRYRLPIGMAAWGFGLVAVLESLRYLWRGQPPAPSDTASTPTAPSTEELLNQLLAQAEAKRESSEPAPTSVERDPGSSDQEPPSCSHEKPSSPG